MSQESNQVEDQGTSIRQLVADVAKDAKHLLSTQSELAKIERTETQQQATATGGLFAVAAVAAVLGGIFLLVTLAYVLVELGLPTWAGFGIVTLALLLVALITALMGKKKAGGIKPFAATKLEIERTKQALSGGPGTEVAKAPETAPQQR